MRKSGLQKQVAFIFDEVPMPSVNPAVLSLPVQQQTPNRAQTPVQDESPSRPADTQKKPSLVQRMTAVQTEAAHTPVVSTLRPKPLPKTRMTADKPKLTQAVVARIKKRVSGSSAGTLDPRQKKAAIMVGVLSVVFAAVLMISLGGLGQSGAKAANKKAAPVEATAQAGQDKPLKWETPQPIPAQLRNPMNPQVTRTSQDAAAAGAGQMVVKGIVFTKENPSAIIDGQIVRQGQILNGVTIVKINKDSVEFQTDDKRWTQPVQR